MVQIISDIGASGYVRAVLRFEAPLDEGVLTRAVRLLYDQEPVLACRFDATVSPPVWRRHDDLDALAEVEVLKTDDETEALGRIQAERFPQPDPGRPPANLRATVIRTDAGDTLVLTMSHVPADGTALLDSCQKIARLYTRLLAEPGFRPEVNTASRDSFDWMRSFRWRDYLGMLKADVVAARRRRGPSWGIRSDWASFQARRVQVQPAHHEHRIGPDRLHAIDLYARARQVTLNDVLTAAYFRAYAAIFPPPPGARLELTVPTNMRRYAQRQAEPAIRNLGSVIYMTIGSELGTGFEDTLRLVAEETRRHKRRLLGTEFQLPQLLLRRLPFAWNRALIGKALRKQLEQPSPPTMTNVGLLRPESVRFGDLEPSTALVLTEAAPLPIFLVTVLRMGSHLALGLGYDADELPPTTVAAFFAELDHNLRFDSFAEPAHHLLEETPS